MATAPAQERRQALEAYLRDEFDDAERQAITEIPKAN
jgi:hypothetical protein